MITSFEYPLRTLCKEISFSFITYYADIISKEADIFIFWLSNQIIEFSFNKSHNSVRVRLVLKLNHERSICTWAAYRELLDFFGVSVLIQIIATSFKASKSKPPLGFSTLYPPLYSPASHLASGWQTHFPVGVPPCDICHINRPNVSTNNSGSVSDLRCMRNKSKMIRAAEIRGLWVLLSGRHKAAFSNFPQRVGSRNWKWGKSLCTGLIELSCPCCKAGLITFSSSITPWDWLQVSKEAALDKGKWPRGLLSLLLSLFSAGSSPNNHLRDLLYT